MKGCKDFGAREFGLRSLPVVQIGPWIYVDFSQGNHPIYQQLGGLDEAVKALKGLNYESLVHVVSKDYDINCNWKVRAAHIRMRIAPID